MELFFLTFMVMIGIFFITGLVLYIVWFIIILFNSKFFRISPSISSDVKSSKIIAKYIKNYIEKNKVENPRVLDIGSGYGRLLFFINKEIKNVNLVGYEISKFAFKISKMLNFNKNIHFVNDNIFNLKDFDFDIITTFLFVKQQKEIKELYQKFKVGTIIISNSFKIPFEEDDGFELIDVIPVHPKWNVNVYKKIE